MKQATIEILNNLNKQFYDETGSVVWNQKPDYYWEGWYQLTSFISENLKVKSEKLYKILDIGCGNARFSNFIDSELPIKQIANIEYLGVDFSVNFLEQCHGGRQQNYANYELKQMDILKELEQLQGTNFDFVVMFGLIHHIPSFENRKKFFRKVVKLLNPNGLLVFTTWQYLDTPRLIKRVVDPDTEAGKRVYQRLGVKKTDLEVGDNILDWVKKVFSYRYSHYFSEEEIQGYINDNNLELIHNFICDGRDSKRNWYYICRVGRISL
jgi:tRNA (uracil-5-)-methyltransferase TRM9